jgi:hypothetical protein
VGERNAQTLADLFCPHLVENQGRANIRCKSKEEAADLATELRARGWKAKSLQALVGSDDFGNMSVWPYVECTGRRRSRPATAGAEDVDADGREVER